MTSMFPIYDEIVFKLDGTETTLTKTHCATINRLPQEHIDILYLLILHHYLKDRPGKHDFPYGSRTISNGKGMVFRRLNQLPDDIQKIICKYITVSIQK